MQTCDGDFRRPFAGAVQDALLDRLHMTGVILILHAEDVAVLATFLGCCWDSFVGLLLF